MATGSEIVTNPSIWIGSSGHGLESYSIVSTKGQNALSLLDEDELCKAQERMSRWLNALRLDLSEPAYVKGTGPYPYLSVDVGTPEIAQSIRETIRQAIEKGHRRDEYREPFVGSGIRGRCHDWTIRDMKVGNRQRMTPVEYRIVGKPSPFGCDSVRIDGDVIIDGQKVGYWKTTIERKYLDVVKENLGSRKEQLMDKSLYEIFIVNEGKFVDMWTGVASTAERARFKALRELKIDINIEDLDILTLHVGNLRDDCCK